MLVGLYMTIDMSVFLSWRDLRSNFKKAIYDIITNFVV